MFYNCLCVCCAVEVKKKEKKRKIFYFKVTFAKSSCSVEVSHQHTRSRRLHRRHSHRQLLCESCTRFAGLGSNPCEAVVLVFFSMRIIIILIILLQWWAFEGGRRKAEMQICFATDVLFAPFARSNIRHCWFHVCVTLADGRRATEPLPVLTQNRTSCVQGDGSWLEGLPVVISLLVKALCCCLTRRSLQGREEFSIRRDS